MIRKANIKDVKPIQKLINDYAKEDLLLPRSLSELYENLRDFFVFEEKGKIYGCCALHINWEDLAEVKSLAVDKSKKGSGMGKALLKACLDEAKKLKVKKVFCLTYQPKFFKKFGFKEIDRAKLPHKIWNECVNCVKFPDCCEVALMIQL
jgi:amino-acid N-acetyltransferase